MAKEIRELPYLAVAVSEDDIYCSSLTRSFNGNAREVTQHGVALGFFGPPRANRHRVSYAEKSSQLLPNNINWIAS